MVERTADKIKRILIRNIKFALAKKKVPDEILDRIDIESEVGVSESTVKAYEKAKTKREKGEILSELYRETMRELVERHPSLKQYFTEYDISRFNIFSELDDFRRFIDMLWEIYNAADSGDKDAIEQIKESGFKDLKDFEKFILKQEDEYSRMVKELEEKREPKTLKRYENVKELISKTKSHLLKRYKVPKSIVEKIDFEKYLKPGMTLPEAREVLMEAYPEIKPYILRDKVKMEVETIEEDVKKKEELLLELFNEAVAGDSESKKQLIELIKKAAKGDKDIIDLIRSTFDTTPGEFARDLVALGVLTEKEYNQIFRKRVEKPKKEENLLLRYSYIVKDIGKELDAMKRDLSKINLDYIAKHGIRFVEALIAKYRLDIDEKLKKLKEFEDKLPEKSREIENIIARVEKEFSKYDKLLERFTPVDIESIIERLSSKVEKIVRNTVADVLNKMGLGTEVAIEEAVEIAEASCTCYYCGKQYIVALYENKAVCDVHALELERKWKEQGLPPQWNPDNVAVCTECGRQTTMYRCSGGLTYCLDCAKRLEGQILFDDELALYGNVARTITRRILGKYGLR